MIYVHGAFLKVWDIVACPEPIQRRDGYASAVPISIRHNPHQGTLLAPWIPGGAPNLGEFLGDNFDFLFRHGASPLSYRLHRAHQRRATGVPLRMPAAFVLTNLDFVDGAADTLLQDSDMLDVRVVLLAVALSEPCRQLGFHVGIRESLVEIVTFALIHEVYVRQGGAQ
jgi:hypothetical protein